MFILGAISLGYFMIPIMLTFGCAMVVAICMVSDPPNKSRKWLIVLMTAISLLGWLAFIFC